ncbi:MAG: hypothetical protein JJE21_11050 [Spirochaetaceae bacterium]|nr:hypothetical protein [Spirochaetaceae bacterium]
MGKPKYRLETIPVWDGVQSDSECFLCDLMDEAEKHGVEFYLGSSVMNPETRVRVNEYGFCEHHFQLINKSKLSAQNMGLICDTYLSESRSKFEKAFNNVLNAKPGRKTVKAVEELSIKFASREKGCLICSQMKSRLDRYVYTIICLWDSDPLFKEALEQSKGFCLHHYEILVKTAPSVLGAKEANDFIKAITNLELKNLDRIAEENLWLTQKYKSENHDKPWRGCEDAQHRTINKIVGKHRVLDPIAKVN